MGTPASIRAQGGAADAGLRGGAVGTHNLADQADGVGELLLGGDHRLERALSQRAVADLAAAGAAHGLRLARGVRRACCIGACSACVSSSRRPSSICASPIAPKRHHGHDLSLAAGEHGAAVRAGQYARSRTISGEPQSARGRRGARLHRVILPRTTSFVMS